MSLQVLMRECIFLPPRERVTCTSAFPLCACGSAATRNGGSSVKIRESIESQLESAIRFGPFIPAGVPRASRDAGGGTAGADESEPRPSRAERRPIKTAQQQEPTKCRRRSRCSRGASTEAFVAGRPDS